MKLATGIAFLAGLVLGAGAVALTLHFRGDATPVFVAQQASTPAPVEPPPRNQVDKESEHLGKLAGEWASWDGQQAATFDGRILRFQAAKGWPDLAGKSFLLGRDFQILSESGLYFVKAYDSDPDALHFIKRDLASEDHSSFILFRAGTPRARARDPLPDGPLPRVIQAFLDSMDQLNLGVDRVLPPDTPAEDLKIDVLLYDATSLGGQNAYMILRLGEGDEWMIEQDVSGRKITRQRTLRGSAELVRKHEGGISEYLYPYYVNGKLITGVSATGLHQVKVLREESGDR